MTKLIKNKKKKLVDDFFNIKCPINNMDDVFDCDLEEIIYYNIDN